MESTQPSLLEGMRSGDPVAWERLVDIWTPLVYDYCRRRGFGASEAEDITQNVMLRIYRGVHRFQRDGHSKRLRYWVMAILRNEVAEFCRNNQAATAGNGGSELQEMLVGLADPNTDGASDDDVCPPAMILARTLSVIRTDFEPHVWQAFELFKIQGLSARETAAQVEMTENGVRQAALRVCRRVKTEMADLLS
jgi:RNA polymerase sigma-70 factor (ECF subfamily)